MGTSQQRQEASPGSGDLVDPLFSEPAVEKEVVPTSRLFLDVVQRQWTSPGLGPFPNSQDKHLYIGPDLAKALEVPTVDTSVAAMSTSSVMTGAPEEALHPEDQRSEQILVMSHQAAI